MTTRHKKPLVALLMCAAWALSLAIATTVWHSRAQLQVKVFDSNFHVLSAKVLRRSRDGFYLGNQLEGGVRHFLRSRCHFNVSTLYAVSGQSFTRLSGDDVCTFALCCSYATTPSPIQLNAELIDCSGASLSVRQTSTLGINPLMPPTNAYCVFFDLDRERTNAGNYTLKLKRAGVSLAEVEIKDLPPVLHSPSRIAPNAF